MRFRPFGTTGWEVSALGLGTALLPSTSGGYRMRAVEMIRNAIDCGINYIDLGDPQYKEPLLLVREALDNGYREKVRIALGLPVASPTDIDRFLKERLEGLGTGKVDFCFLSGLDRITWPRAQELNLLNYLDKVRADGLVNHAGFAFHDHFQYLRAVVEGYDDWTFCRFRYSYMDVNHHPGTMGLKYAQEKRLAVVIAEALLSGRLVNNPPESVIELCTHAPSQRTLASLGLSWVLNHPEVATVVSNMSNLEQVMENVAVADEVHPDSLTVRELLLVSRLRDCYLAKKAIPCPTCRPCMPCPVGIDAPRILELYNEAVMYGDREIPGELYRLEGHSIDDCTECGACAKRCGRKIRIPERLKDADVLLTMGPEKK
jgi:uncharacterized protein